MTPYEPRAAVVAPTPSPTEVPVQVHVSYAAPDRLVPVAELPGEQAAWRRLIASGRLPAVKHGRQWLVRESDILALPAPQRRAPVANEPEDNPRADMARRIATGASR